MHPLRKTPDATLWVNIGTTNHKKPMLNGEMRGLLKRLFEREGIKKRQNPHLFRHSRATFMANHLTELQNRMRLFIGEGVIKKEKVSEHVHFFLENARKSLQSAELLYKVSTKKELEETIGFRDFDGFLWVVNASYYSIFYMSRVLLENEGIKLRREQSIHVLAFDALVYYFYLSEKLQKHLIEYFIQAKEDAAELLGKQKADELFSKKDILLEKCKKGLQNANKNERLVLFHFMIITQGVFDLKGMLYLTKIQRNKSCT